MYLAVPGEILVQPEGVQPGNPNVTCMFSVIFQLGHEFLNVCPYYGSNSTVSDCVWRGNCGARRGRAWQKQIPYVTFSVIFQLGHGFLYVCWTIYNVLLHVFQVGT